MQFNSSLAIIILEKLVKLGIRSNFFGFDGTFTNEELDIINDLTITNCDSIDGISNLKNLKSLRIIGPNLYSFNETAPLNNIIDFSEINKLSSLERLEIIYDENIEILDIRNLDRLTVLKLFCNSKLVKIRGLDSKKNLKKVIICDCPIIDIGNTSEYILNTVDTSVNILDIKMFANLFSDKTRVLLKNRYNISESNIRFGEHIYFHDEIYTLDIYQMMEIYKKAQNLLKKLDISSKNQDEQAFAIYQFVISYLSYDHEGLDYRNKNYKEILNADEESKKYILRRMAIINSSFGALNTRKVVCDGYVNLLRLLFTIYQIKTETVICKAGDLTHAAVKYYVNGKWYYADPEKDHDKTVVKFFNLTKEEFEKLYTLSPKEYIEQIDGVKMYEKHFN